MMEFILQEADMRNVESIINEADDHAAFLADKDDPDFHVKDFIKQHALTTGFHLFALVHQESIAGFITILPARDESTVSIGPMYILKEHQGLGLGKRQVAEVIQWARASGFKKLYTKTWGQNTRSRRIFECLGFILVEEVPNKRVNGDSTVKYSFDLS